jgi:hypothetical protein
MARVIAMLEQARAAGLDVHRDGADLVVRGAARQEHLARDLLGHKALVLAAMEQEEKCREHERSEHLGQSVDWRLADYALVCCTCHQALIADQGGEPAEVSAAGPVGEDQAAAAPACSMCGSAGRCQGRLAMLDGGWVCLAAVADGVLRNGRLRGPRRPPGAETER